MNLNRVRLRLTLAYVGIFALIVFLLGTVAVVGFLQELTAQQDDLLAQEAINQTSNLLDGENREVLAAGSGGFGDLEAETAEDGGAVFRFRLPVE